MKKAIITVLGKDKVGIIAAVCSYLADCNINICDISQTIVDDYFNMMMIVDISNASKTFKDISTGLEQVGKKTDLLIKIQKEEIFTSMHEL